MSIEAVIAANRFGLGARPGELSQIAADPRGWLKQQVGGSRPTPQAIAALPSSADAYATFLETNSQQRQQRREQRREARAEAQSEPSMGEQMKPDTVKPDTVKPVQQARRSLLPLHQQQVQARYQVAIRTEESFRERLVHFWTNHFTVSAAKPEVFALAGTLENEAVRPNLSGRFVDLLLAVESHPAMILYLDNQTSFGPNSRWAQSVAARNPERKLDINENLAREVLELHTLGAQGGYTQQDVTTFAHVLTGWSINIGRYTSEPVGIFRFHEAAHEPGAKALLGKRYTQEGEAQGRAVLDDLARHPATAEHIARKLVRHFVADEPPAAAVARITQVFRDTEGSLPEVHAALADLPQAWNPKPAKYKTPHEFLVSAYRAMGNGQNPAIGHLMLLGQPTFRPGSPAGWPDTASHWDSPDALLKRVEWATRVSEGLDPKLPSPVELATESLGAVLSKRTHTAIARAANAAQAITLWLVSPEFLRR